MMCAVSRVQLMRTCGCRTSRVLLAKARHHWACKSLHTRSIELLQLRAASSTPIICDCSGLCWALESQQQAGLSTLKGNDARPRLASPMVSGEPRHGMLALGGPTLHLMQGTLCKAAERSPRPLLRMGDVTLSLSAGLMASFFVARPATPGRPRGRTSAPRRPMSATAAAARIGAGAGANMGAGKGMGTGAGIGAGKGASIGAGIGAIMGAGIMLGSIVGESTSAGMGSLTGASMGRITGAGPSARSRHHQQASVTLPWISSFRACLHAWP